jgi:hypothetical protein
MLDCMKNSSMNLIAIDHYSSTINKMRHESNSYAYIIQVHTTVDGKSKKKKNVSNDRTIHRIAMSKPGELCIVT